jgi:hypothetical protein
MEEAPAPNLQRRNSVGKGLKSVSFSVDVLEKKTQNQDKLLVNQSSTMKSLEKELLEYKNRVGNLERMVSEILDG